MVENEAPKRSKRNPSPAAKTPSSGRATPLEQPVIAPLNVVVRRLVLEAVASRLRHRALLQVIETGAFTKDSYLESYKTIYDRDHEALIALMLLRHDDFEAAFSEWREEDITRYGIPDRVDALRKRGRSKKPASRKSSS